MIQMKTQVKIIKCRNCGTHFKVDPDNPAFSSLLVVAGVAIGAVVGSILPGIGTGRGGLMGARCVADAMRGRCVCPWCGEFIDANSTKS